MLFFFVPCLSLRACHYSTFTSLMKSWFDLSMDKDKIRTSAGEGRDYLSGRGVRKDAPEHGGPHGRAGTGEVSCARRCDCGGRCAGVLQHLRDVTQPGELEDAIRVRFQGLRRHGLQGARTDSQCPIRFVSCLRLSPFVAIVGPEVSEDMSEDCSRDVDGFGYP